MVKTVCAKIGNCGSSGGTYADAQEDRARGQRLFGGADAGGVDALCGDGNEAAGSLRENNLRDRDVLRVGLWQTAETRNGEVLTY